MTTSGTTTFNPTRNQIIYGALRLVGAYEAGNQPRSIQVVNAAEALDMMLKSWQRDGFLWLKQTVYITLVAAQSAYTIGPASTDTVTTDAVGAVPFTQRPSRVFFPARRTISSGYEVPLVGPISRQEYMSLSNKATPGTPNQVYYDPRINSGALYVWPVPTSVGDQVVLTADRTIEDIGDEEKTLDIPPEDIRTVKWNLALELAPEYGMKASDRDRLEKFALMMKQKTDIFNTDDAPVYFQPGR
jgi:hypothetical protein